MNQPCPQGRTLRISIALRVSAVTSLSSTTTCSSMKSALMRPLLLIALLGTLGSLPAEPLTFTLEPELSSVTLSGSASGAALQAQGPGSLTSFFAGTLVLDVTDTEVRFPGGSRLIPGEPNSWQPGPAGADGSAPASYGGKATIGSGFFSVSAVAATRRLSFDVLSAALPISGGSFTAEGLLFQFVATNSPVLDYRTSGLLSQRGSRALDGLATNKLAGNSTLVTQGNVQTLTIPVDAAYRFTLLAPDDSVLQLNGQIVATRTISADSPTIVITPVAPGATSMTLSWPAGFKLQKSPRLENPDWGDTGATSPATIEFTTTGEYFQVVPQ